MFVFLFLCRIFVVTAQAMTPGTANFPLKAENAQLQNGMLVSMSSSTSDWTQLQNVVMMANKDGDKEVVAPACTCTTSYLVLTDFNFKISSGYVRKKHKCSCLVHAISVTRSTIKGVKVDLERSAHGSITGVDMRLVHDGKLIGANMITNGTSPKMWPQGIEKALGGAFAYDEVCGLQATINFHGAVRVIYG
jgi:hypothetical protein